MADPAQITPLAQILLEQIAAAGPMGLHQFMAECLLHPEHGYYTTKSPFGAAGDFITAPEISQMFGEMLGLALAQAWIDQGAPALFTLAELGPGRGTLMADVLRATRGVPGFHAAARPVLVEASPRLRVIQAATLAGYPITWADDVAHLPQAPLFVLANEFFDALPIRQFQRQGDLWCETLVGAQDGRLVFGRSAPSPALPDRLIDTIPRDIVEICPAAPGIMAHLSQRICDHGGAGLIIDYGDWRGVGDTFQAMAAHRYVAPLDAPGTADLTAHVDFAALAAIPAQSAFTTQGALLTRLGLGARSAHLARGLTGQALENHLRATDRLTAPTEMGKLFKALGIWPQGAAPLAGFDRDQPC